MVGKDYEYNEHDASLLKEMFKEIKRQTGVSYHYLAEIDQFYISGCGEIMQRYFRQFESESVRAYLIPQIVSDKVVGCVELLISGYSHFKMSDEYIASCGQPSPAHITVRYDNAFRRLRPKKYSQELLSLVKNPRDAVYLPLTFHMVSSWKIPEMEEVILRYLDSEKLTTYDFGLNASEGCYPTMSFMKKELVLSAIEGIRFYPTDNNVEAINRYMNNKDDDIRSMAKKTMKTLKRFFDER